MRQLVFLVLASLIPLPLIAAENARYVPIEQRLTGAQMQQTGLDKLEPGQLALLNRLLDEEQASLVETAKAQGSREASAGRLMARDTQPVTSRIVGEIRGWSNGNVLTLENGQRWRVVQGDLFLRKPLSNPEVHITISNMGAWHLQIEGQNQRAKVERLD